MKKQKTAKDRVKNLSQKILNRQAELLAEVLENLTPFVLEQGHPADRVLLRFFKNRRELGSRDRRFLSEAFFSLFRWRGWTTGLELTPLQAATLSWQLDQVELHPALNASNKGWVSLGGKTLDEKRDALQAWFPDADGFEKSSLVFPEFGEHADLPAGQEDAFYETLQQRPPAWLRLRTPTFENVLAEAEVAFEKHARIADVVSISGGTGLTHLGHAGKYEVQDIASQAVALIAAPDAGGDWWDACAGAGGKALQLADLIGRDGKVFATDVRPEALQECKKRARADGISNVRIQEHNLADDAPFTKEFDGVLVDAPCSGWGTWSRNPDARWRSDPRDPAQKRNMQLRMLNNATACVKSGGLLIFAVCTFTKEETVEVTERFLADHEQFALEPFENPLSGEPCDGALQIWPWEGPGDGMYIARFRKA